jgi:hypothetical protein
MESRGYKSAPRRRRRSSPAVVLAAIFTLGVYVATSGCAGDGPDPESLATGSFAALQTDVFAVHCATGPCHSAATAAGGLVLEGPDAFDQLVGAQPTNESARSAGWLRVAPGSLERSFLWVKLTGPGPGQGSRMPLGAPPLAAADLQRIEDWILAGAPRGDLGGPGLTPTASPTPTQTLLVPSPTPGAVAFSELQNQVFTPRCAVAFCHDGTTKAGALDLTDAYASLVNVAPTNAAAREAGWLRVAPGQVERSFLLTKLTLTTFDPRWGSPMPLSGARLESFWIAAIEDWIRRGAPRTDRAAP